MLTKDFDYYLPEELIASRPLEDRSASRMIVVHRDSGKIEHRMFANFPEYMQPDDLLILNDTKVIPARLFSNDGEIEIVITDRISDTEWACMVRPGKKMRLGYSIEIDDTIGKVIDIQENGNRVVKWNKPLDIHKHGSLALPHYMGRDSDAKDLDRYQTIFAREEGAIAAPTAGLHFTPEILAQLNHDFLTLHVGVGTFRTVSVDHIRDHEMHSEKYSLSKNTAEKINAAPRLTAVGTTVTRVLESLAREHPHLTECSGSTDIFIYPGFEFKIVDRLLTNFHLPMSTLIMLVSAFASRDLILEAYQQAVTEKYRFFSYGDCMLIL